MGERAVAKESVRVPLWAWSVTLLIAAALMGLVAQVVFLTSWEGDRASLEEHRALFHANALAQVVAQHGDYEAQRFAVSLASQPGAGVTEAFVIADGGVDDFGISRGQSYTAHLDKSLRGRVLSDLKDSPRHRVRADRFSRATSGLEQPQQPGRAAPWFVLERDRVGGRELIAAQVPAIQRTDGQPPKVLGSAGVSLEATMPEAPLPWMSLLLLVLAGWLAGTGVLYGARKALPTSAARGVAMCALAGLFAVALGLVTTHDYRSNLEPWAQQRVQDIERVQKAADYAQVRGDDWQAVLQASDLTFANEPGYLLPEGASLEGAAEALLDRRYSNQRAVLWVSLLALVGLLALGHRLLGRMVLTCRTQPHAYLYVAPSIAGMVLLVFVPFATGVGLSVFDNDARRYYFVGMNNFMEILAGGGSGSDVSFYWTLFTTILWTVSNVILHVGIGLGLALLLKDPALRFKRLYRVLLVVPWAIPNYITALIWKGMFNKEFGAVNQILGLLQSWMGQEPSGVDWLGGSFATAFTANLVTNTWLGFPFMMVVSLGALQSIPGELYEAADVDGASAWQKFQHITVPLLKPALFPAIILGTIWTFNMFNVIYLVSGGGPNNSTEILITDAYRAFAVLNRHGLAAAYSVIIFLILFVYTVMTNRITKATEGAFE